MMAGMHPHAAEIVPEPRLEISARRRIERLPRRTEYLIHDRRHLTGGDRSHPRRLLLKFFFFLSLAGSAFAAHLRWRGTKRHLRHRHAHHLFGNPIRLMLQRIIDGADFEVRLNGRPGEARCQKLGRRLEFAAHPLGRKGRYLAEIPSKAARSSFASHAFRADVLPGIAVLVLDETLSPQKPEHRLVADRPLKDMQVFGAAIVKTMAKRCSAVKRRCVFRGCGGLRVWLCNWRSKHGKRPQLRLGAI